jgi:hypothetical protein
VCDPTLYIKVGANCVKCSNDAQSTGVPSNATVCQCKPHFTWDSSSSTCKCLSPLVLANGLCGCPTPLAFNENGVCACDTTYTIAKSNGECFSCVGLQYSTGTTVFGNVQACACVSTFLFSWNSDTQTGVCACPALKKLNPAGTACICDSSKTTCTAPSTTCEVSKGFLTKQSTCINCRDIPFSTGNA